MQKNLAQSIRKIMGSGRNRAHDAAALALAASVLVGLVTTVEAAPRPAPDAPTVTRSQDAFADMGARFDARSRQMDADFDARSAQMDRDFDARSAEMDREFDARVAESDRLFDRRATTMGDSGPTASGIERDHRAAVARIDADHASAVAGIDARHDEAVRRINGAASEVEAHHLAAVADIDRHHREAVERMDSGSSLEETSTSASPSMADVPDPGMPTYGTGRPVVPHAVDADVTRDGLRTRVDEKRTVVRELRGDGVTVTHTTYEMHAEMHGHVRGRLEMDDQPSFGLK